MSTQTYQIEVFSQEDENGQNACRIEKMTPVGAGMGILNSSPKFRGFAQLVGPPGMPPFPLRFFIEAKDIAEAFQKFADSAKAEVKRLKDESQKQIVVPQGNALPPIPFPARDGGMTRG